MNSRCYAIFVLSLVASIPATAADPAPAASRSVPRAIALPDTCNTPDAMAVLASGDIVLSVPNFTDPTSPGVLMKVTPDDQVSLFCKLPVDPQTGHACPMGIRQAPSGDLYVADAQILDETPNNSRLLCVRLTDGKPGQIEVVAQGLNIANGVAIHDGAVYVTDSSVATTDDKKVVSLIYRFGLDERNVKVLPDGTDPHVVAKMLTSSQDIPVGADGIDFDAAGNLYVANCGDGFLEKFTLDAAGKVTGRSVLTKPGLMKSADGIFYDRATKQIFVADILANAICAVSLDGKVRTIAQDPDNDGTAGQLDGPSEAVVRGDEVIVANFDRIFPGCVNTTSEKPYTLSVIKRDK
jgi:sugar lactone lactonase YvrE